MMRIFIFSACSENEEGNFRNCFLMGTRKENQKTSGLDFQRLRRGNLRPKHFEGLFCWFMAESALTPESFKLSLLARYYTRHRDLR